MWKFLLIFLLTALIVQYLYRDKNSTASKSDTVKRKKPTREPIREPAAPREKKQRGEIFEPNGYITQYGITYYDVHEEDSDYEYLASQGYQGGGPSWEGIIYGVLKIKDIQLLDRIEFDPEGDGLLINGQNKQDMEMVSYWIDEVKADRKLMKRAIMMANIDGRME